MDPWLRCFNAFYSWLKWLHWISRANWFCTYFCVNCICHHFCWRTRTSTCMLGRFSKNSHILELHSVGHIPNSSVHLISLGKLLANGAKVNGDVNFINVTYGDGKILAPFIPWRIDIGMYTLKALLLHAKPHLTLTNTISYNIVHQRLGDPSKDVLRHAHKPIKNLPDVEIPTEVPICPGCAMGKLPNRSFPPNQWCATCMFGLIHSDLKSFPTESYHHHKCIITFVDNFTSMAWTTPLHSKDTALVSTKHFLKMVST